eukprot:TRINITY_DN24218_c0_g1_i1.p1 TRINITY_DN24218_c0_g1~~TRINITY_DN24218_c0_g1_i1.p1  ORF type:complete len:439 (-),score=85.86 TRINITY_DN24218_c0_g1_i1:47-1312(-)
MAPGGVGASACFRRKASAYRGLLRLCREADRDPTLLAAMLGRPPRRYDRVRGQTASTAARTRWVFVDDAAARAGGGCTEFPHPVPGERAAALAARHHFELAATLGLDYESEAGEFRRRLEVARQVVSEVKRTRPSAARAQKKEAKLADLEKLPHLERIPPCAERGCFAQGELLISHPLSCVLQHIFDQALILVDEVSQDGVRGVVLNKPADTTLRSLLSSLPQNEDVPWTNEMGPLLDMPLYIGGPVMDGSLERSVTLLHSFGDRVPGAVHIAPRLWVGGDVTLLSTLALQEPQDIRVLLGFAGWARQQLTTEVERGVWVRARAAKDAPDSPRIGAAAASPLDLEAAADASATPVREERAKFADLVLGLAAKRPMEPTEVWRSALCGAGMAGLAAFPRSEATDERLARLLMKHYEEEERAE